MNESQALAAFSALTDPTRLAILRHLVTKGAEGASAGEIGAAVTASPSRAAFHLSTLKQAGLLTSEKVSRNVIYRVNFARMGALVAYLVEDCCAGDARVKSCCAGLFG